VQTRQQGLLHCFARPHASHANPQAAIRRPLPAQAQIISHSSECGVCGVQYGTDRGFSSSTLALSCQYHSSNAPFSLSYLQSTVSDDIPAQQS